MERVIAEQIRYAWGSSSLGDFLAAVSQDGLVAFGFSDSKKAALDELRASMSGAIFNADDADLSGVVCELAAIVEHPASALAIPLDPRGSDYQKQVWSMLRDIPAVETTSYGTFAAKLGTRDARDVTEAIATNAIAILSPCHRVVKKDGSISGYRWGVPRRRALLERERQAAPFRLEQ